MTHRFGVSALLTGIVLLSAAAAPAAVLTVTKTADSFDQYCDTDCSLRDAVSAANAGAGSDVILLPAGVFTLTRPGAGEDANATGDLDVRNDLTVIGAGANLTVIDGGGLDRVIDVIGAARLALVGVTLRHGSVVGDGGGLRSGFDLTLDGVLVAGNAALGEGWGGGIFAPNADIEDSAFTDNQAALGGGGVGACRRLERSTISGNRAGFGGGVTGGHECILRNVTISDNQADGEFGGGGYFSLAAPCGEFCHLNPGSAQGVVIAGNRAAKSPDCFGDFPSAGFNVIGIADGCDGPVPADRFGSGEHPLDARLGPLDLHGGSTPTQLPDASSPAVDLMTGDTPCAGPDQRGVARPFDGNGDGLATCDAGAAEVNGGCFNSPTGLCLGGRFLVSASFVSSSASGTAHAVPLTADTGTFWFFAPENLEIMVKVLDGCAVNQRQWVFASGLTNVHAVLTVHDTVSGTERHYERQAGPPFTPILDTSAFELCH